MFCCNQFALATGGICALFKGTVPNLVRVVPYGAFLFFTYELMRDFFTEYDVVCGGNMRANVDIWGNNMGLIWGGGGICGQFWGKYVENMCVLWC